MSSKTTELSQKHLRLNKSYIDSRGNLYLAKDYLPNELPLQVIEKGHVSIISEDSIDSFSVGDFKVVDNLVPEQKVEVKTRSLNTKKKPNNTNTEVIDLNPIEAVNPTLPSSTK